MTDREMQRRARQPRWATRQEAMAYGKIGATKMNELMQGGRIVAKKDGNKVIVDLNSIDDHYDALPQVGADNARAAALAAQQQPGRERLNDEKPATTLAGGSTGFSDLGDLSRVEGRTHMRHVAARRRRLKANDARPPGHPPGHRQRVTEFSGEASLLSTNLIPAGEDRPGIPPTTDRRRDLVLARRRRAQFRQDLFWLSAPPSVSAALRLARFSVDRDRRQRFRRRDRRAVHGMPARKNRQRGRPWPQPPMLRRLTGPRGRWLDPLPSQVRR